MKAAPRIRRDKSCYECKGERTERAIQDGDPFCSTKCCRAYYGTLLVKRERVA